MSIHTNNIFKNSFEKHDIENKSKKIYLDKNLKSKKFSEYNFANFYESNLSIEYKILKDIITDFKRGVDIIEKYFKIPEFIGKGKKIDRMFKIINKITNVEYTPDKDLGFIFKLDLKDEYKNNSIRFYFYKISNSYNLLLVDLYHLVIYTNDQNIENDYKYVSNYSGNICNIK